MEISSILLHAAAETCEPSCGPSAVALQLAKAFGARLTALVYELDVALPRSAYGQRITAEARVTVAARNEDARERADSLRVAAAEMGLRADVLTNRSFAYTVPEIVAERARLYDLTVTGSDQHGLLSEHAIAEYTLFHSGQPLLLVPKGYAGGFTCEKVVVAWDYSRAASRALSDSLPLLRRAADVAIVTFGDDKEIESSLGRNDVIASLQARGVIARYEEAQRGDQSIADAINDFCAERGTTLLVMGGYGHSRFREFVLGGATRGILQAPALPTFLSH